MRFAPALLLLIAGCAPDGVDISDRPTVLVFVEPDCPVSNAYAPEIARLDAAYGASLRFLAVYPADATPDRVREHRREYGVACAPLIDAGGRLTRRARIATIPEAAIFLPASGLVYHGRIDDRYADVGVKRPAPTSHDLEDAIRAVLRGETPRGPTGPSVGCPVPG